MMLVFNLYDSWQLWQDGIYYPRTPSFTEKEEEWAYYRKDIILATIERLRAKGALTGVFAINCFSHGVIEYNESAQTDIKIKDKNLNDAVAQWFRGEEAIYV